MIIFLSILFYFEIIEIIKMNSNNKKVKILDQFKKNKKPVESKSKVSEPQINSKLPVEILERIFKIAAVNRFSFFF